MTVSNVILVIDESASMAAVRVEADRAVLSWLSSIADGAEDAGIPALVTLITFNAAVRVRAQGIPARGAAAHFRGIRPENNTALRDALGHAVGHANAALRSTGDDSTALVVAVTDGEENASLRWTAGRLQEEVTKLLATGRADVALLVPRGARTRAAREVGLPEDRIREWEVTAEGAKSAGEMVTRSFGEYYTARGAGRAPNSFFVDPDRIADLSQLPAVPAPLRFTVTHRDPQDIAAFVNQRAAGTVFAPYRPGSAYYELTKSERLQPGRGLLVHDVPTDRWYAGINARRALGLPDSEARVRPGDVTRRRVFIQSTSINRKLVPGTDVVLR